MRKTDWLVAAALALCVAGLAACGGGSNSDGGGDSASREDAILEFAECMRAHGVDLPDPQPGENVIEPGDPNDPAAKVAQEACDEKLEKFAQDVSPEEDEEFREGWLAFSKCMREEGIDLADPQFLGPGKVQLGIAGIETDSPAFEAAREACEDEAPDMDVDGPVVGG
jgi:hypothetical protein